MRGKLEALMLVLAAPVVGAMLAIVLVVDMLMAKGGPRPLPEDGPTGRRCRG